MPPKISRRACKEFLVCPTPPLVFGFGFNAFFGFRHSVALRIHACVITLRIIYAVY